MPISGYLLVMNKFLNPRSKFQTSEREDQSAFEAEHASFSTDNGSEKEGEVISLDEDTAAIIDEQTEESFDWRAELMQLEQENRRNEVSLSSQLCRRSTHRLEFRMLHQRKFLEYIANIKV